LLAHSKSHNDRLVSIAVLGALVVFVFVGFFTQDMFGRRILLMVGAAIARACMLTYATISTVEGPQLSRGTGIGAVFLCESPYLFIV